MVDTTDQNGSTAVTNNNSASFPGRRKKSRHDVIEDEQRERQLLPDPFTNNMMLDPFDWIVLGIGTILILPFRVLGVVFTMCLAWFVAKIGLFGIPEEELYSPLSKRSFLYLFFNCRKYIWFYFTGGPHHMQSFVCYFAYKVIKNQFSMLSVFLNANYTTYLHSNPFLSNFSTTYNA